MKIICILYALTLPMYGANFIESVQDTLRLNFYHIHKWWNPDAPDPKILSDPHRLLKKLGKEYPKYDSRQDPRDVPDHPILFYDLSDENVAQMNEQFEKVVIYNRYKKSKFSTLWDLAEQGYGPANPLLAFRFSCGDPELGLNPNMDLSAVFQKRPSSIEKMRELQIKLRNYWEQKPLIKIESFEKFIGKDFGTCHDSDSENDPDNSDEDENNHNSQDPQSPLAISDALTVQAENFDETETIISESTEDTISQNMEDTDENIVILPSSNLGLHHRHVGDNEG